MICTIVRSTLQWLLISLGLAAPVSAQALQITASYGGYPIVVSADRERLAGAINSLKWKGIEFVDEYDHGRELQSAVSFDGLGDCYNPTEAGSQGDGRGLRTSSKLLSASIEGGVLKTRVDAAFWLPPNTPTNSAKGCGWGTRPDVQITVNTKVRDGYEIEKGVRFLAEKNRLRYDVTFTTPRDHEKARFEIVTAYLPEHFDQLYSVATSGQITQEEAANYQKVEGPPIFSRAGGTHALGVVCKEPAKGRLFYGAWFFKDAKVVKWACMVDQEGVSKGRYAYRAIIVIGTLHDVRTGVRAAMRDIRHSALLASRVQDGATTGM